MTSSSGTARRPTRGSCGTSRGADRPAPALLATLALALAACSSPPVVDRRGPEPGLMAKIMEPVVFEVDDDFDRTPPRCVAVLPFTTALDDGMAMIHAAEVRRAIYAHLAPLPLRDIELAEIDTLVPTLSPAARRDYVRLGRALDCDTLLLGTLLQHRERYLGVYSEIVIGAELELVRTSDGKVLWQARHIASSGDGALPLATSKMVGVVTVVQGAVLAAANLFGDERERVTDDLARRLVATLPHIPPELACQSQRAGPAAGCAWSIGQRTPSAQPAPRPG